MVVAIDGPAGVGKSTIAECAAQKTKFLYVNSGSFYRLITLSVLKSGRNPESKKDIIETARECHFEMREKNLYLNGKQVKDNIHTDAIDKWVSPHSFIPRVRDIVNRDLKKISEQHDIIVEGRDMCTVVFPGAEIKIFLDADLKTRSFRRFQQGVSNLSIEEIMMSLEERDKLDRNKPVGRLEKSPTALYIDTSDLTINQVCEKVVAEIFKRL